MPVRHSSLGDGDVRLLVTGGSGFIGTYLSDQLLRNNPRLKVLNIDIRPPQLDLASVEWRKCDILNGPDLADTLISWEPDYVVHLAARTDTDAHTVGDYAVNTDGTANLLAALERAPSVRRVVITSTQYVIRPGIWPEGDTHYAPHTAYGESKVITERLTREAGLEASWVIVRPTNVWGPRHPRYPSEFWRVLARGAYIHPRGRRVIRAYGYVGNVTWQIGRALQVSDDAVSGRVLYVGDEPIDLYEWVREFSIALRGGPPREAPLAVLKAIALVGDGVSRLGLRAPLTTSRLRNMIEDHRVPMAPTLEALDGAGPYSLHDGVIETTEWLRTQGFRVVGSTT